MNIALIFAGGTGQRMNTRTIPKQFLELHGKPIIIYTLEQFDLHPDIDAIIVVCLESWIERLKQMIKRFNIGKIVDVIPGGGTGQDSIFRGISVLHENFNYPDDSIILIHDGVRPLIDETTIHENVVCAKEHGSSVTVVPATETVILRNQDFKEFGEILDRKFCFMARAPQCFRLGEIYAAHIKARRCGMKDFIDSAQLMSWYGTPLFQTEGKPENIKITTPGDFYIFRAIIDAKENSQIFGL